MSQCLKEGKKIKKSINRFFKRFNPEISLEVVSKKGNVMEFKFSGNKCCSRDIYDYFDGLVLILEEMTDCPYAIWDCNEIFGKLPHSIVRIVKLNFLHEIKIIMKKTGNQVRRKKDEFMKIRESENAVFKELCFCILTANYTAEGGIKIQKNIDQGFIQLKEGELIEKLRYLGYRYPRLRSKYIVEARKYYGKLCEVLGSFEDGKEARKWLVKNIKGFGYKEASHFLRNLGFSDVAIIDRHVLKFLEKKKLLEVPKNLHKNRYLNYERLLFAIAKKLKLSLGELDLYIWYIMTGKILK
jgi:N-glycosylase/DNA lyase